MRISLPDGEYRWQVDLTRFQDSHGFAGRGTATKSFIRLEGDVDGDGRVEGDPRAGFPNGDLAAVTAALGRKAFLVNDQVNCLWDPILDLDGDRVITNADRLIVI